MSAAKRRSGNGTVIVLVIFIVLALAGIGTSIWLYQQNAIMKQAVLANQNDFEEQIAEVFDDENWELNTRADASFGIRYGEEAFGDVRSKLFNAALLEDLRPVIGWDSPQSISDRLSNSPAQKESQEEYKTVRGLLGFYEQEYQRLKRQTEELNSDLENARTKLEEKRSAMNEMQKRLNQEKTEAIQNYKDEMARLREQYEEMQEKYQETRQKHERSQDELDQARQEWDKKFSELQKEARDWKQLYKQATAEEQVVTELQPAGSILDVEPRYEFVVVEGGSEAGWEKGDKIVIYTRSAAGVRTVKGKAVISKVHETTSLATILSQSAQMMENDFFVPQTTWDQYQGRQKKVAQQSSKTTPSKEPSPREDTTTTKKPAETTEVPAETDQEQPPAGTGDTGTTGIEDGADEDGEDEEEGEEEDFIFEF